MEIVHRICVSPKRNAKAYQKFAKIGVEMKETGDGKIVSLSCFDIAESDVLWPKVKKVVTSFGISPVTKTIFTDEEIKSSEWVVVRPEFISGYPMPDLDFGYKNVSFNPEKECPVCGVGAEQIKPIHLKDEPDLGKNDFLGINWTLNIFTKPEIIESMQNKKISGFDVIPAIHHSTMKELVTVKQLEFTKRLSGEIIDENLEKELPGCGHIKYLGLSCGMYKIPSKSLEGVSGFVKTSEWFGSGHLAMNLILAPSEFIKMYFDNKWKGLCLEPVELVH